MAVDAAGFPGQHLHVDDSQTLWQKQVSEHLDSAYIKHSLAKYKNTFRSHYFLHIDRGVSKAGADLSLWNQEPLISDQDQIQQSYGFQFTFFNLSSLTCEAAKSLLRTLK